MARHAHRLAALERRYGPARCPVCSPPLSAPPRIAIVARDAPKIPPCPAYGCEPYRFTINLGAAGEPSL
jgi:hypothetical protein